MNSRTHTSLIEIARYLDPNDLESVEDFGRDCQQNRAFGTAKYIRATHADKRNVDRSMLIYHLDRDW